MNISRILAGALLALAAFSARAAPGASAGVLQIFAMTPAAVPVQSEHIEAELIAENGTFQPGKQNWVALRLRPEPGWHVYWRNQGDSGIPTKLVWNLPQGVSAGEIEWPYPHRHSLGDLTNYGYGEETLHLVPVTLAQDWPAGKSVPLLAEAKWLVCADICIPGSAQLALDAPVSTQAPRPDPDWAEHFAKARAQLPHATDWPARFAIAGGEWSLQVDAPALGEATSIELFPVPNDLVNHAAPQRVAIEASGVRISQPLSAYFVDAPAEVEAVLVAEGKSGDKKAYTIHLKPGAVTPVAAATKPAARAAAGTEAPPARRGLGAILLLALLGGLILNLMPCVFPVLSLKALSVMQARDQDAARQRAHALAYTLGVMLSCIAVAAVLLALRAGGEAIGWGFQLQSPMFIALLIYLLFALGLSLSGVAEFGTGIMGLGQSLASGTGLASSFFTGVLATVVATPCTAPFMGTALGFALTQPASIALLVFAALGLGLALPFLLIGFYPRAAAALPRPGAWMQTFKQAMAFPLYLSVVWLVWVLSRQTDPNGAALVLIGLVLIAFALWLWNSPRRGAGMLRWAALATAVGLLFQPALHMPPGSLAPPVEGAEAWSEQKVADLRAAGRTVFVNFTADWCLTCKVNERVTFRSERVRQAFHEANVAYLVGDWTRADPAIGAVLQRYGHPGVPLYLLYKPGAEPRVLPQVLTPDVLASAIAP
ncbi:MAG TPA: protein-disulfide reductase DsbD domain-containing protein [Solimonas sp.]|nr:protein-disulfide reductase DsbD domain-containing protein [Solimonas sp.]